MLLRLLRQNRRRKLQWIADDDDFGRLELDDRDEKVRLGGLSGLVDDQAFERQFHAAHRRRPASVERGEDDRRIADLIANCGGFAGRFVQTRLFRHRL